jgi:hypothetical protein
MGPTFQRHDRTCTAKDVVLWWFKLHTHICIYIYNLWIFGVPKHQASRPRFIILIPREKLFSATTSWLSWGVLEVLRCQLGVWWFGCCGQHDHRVPPGLRPNPLGIRCGFRQGHLQWIGRLHREDGQGTRWGPKGGEWLTNKYSKVNSPKEPRTNGYGTRDCN